MKRCIKFSENSICSCIAKSAKHVMFYVCMLISVGCSEVFEVQLQSIDISLLMPQDNLITPVVSQLFWWEEVKGATQYRIQIVSPSFDSIYSLISDKFIDSNKFEITLNPGKYQWRVKALNSATESDWFVRSLTIDSTLDLSFQTLLLALPVNQDTGNSMIKTFSWYLIYSADAYSYEIWKPNLSGVQVASGSTGDNSFSFTVNSEGSYLWRARAENNMSVSAYSSRTFYVDTTAPLTSNLIAPLDKDTVSAGDVVFSWLRNLDNGSSLRDSVVIAEDSTFTTVIFNNSIITTSLTANLNAGGYYWKLITKDKAGNQSNQSPIRVVYIQ